MFVFLTLFKLILDGNSANNVLGNNIFSEINFGDQNSGKILIYIFISRNYMNQKFIVLRNQIVWEAPECVINTSPQQKVDFNYLETCTGMQGIIHDTFTGTGG